MFKKIAIIGTGLIGGSLGLAIKKNGIAGEVIGISRQAKNIAFAKKIKAIDRGAQDIGIIQGADLVVFATPVQTIMDLAPSIRRVVLDDCIITDVGSTKCEITVCLEKVFSLFVGSHPLAGSEKSSIRHADKDLFKGSVCVLTQTRNTDTNALKKVEKFWQQVGTKTITLTPHAHDRILSFVSHLPHAIAFSLMRSVPERFFGFAAGGLRDSTRLAASDSLLWADIFLSNRKNLLSAVRSFKVELSRIERAVARHDKRRLKNLLAIAQAKRSQLA
ncbi:MAG: prephenate dehydrogenase/arogenate dehydrogenase family protein [Candidatus Omnitrophica bacterium]|nr:prephenate dehydrogenase/arogenate dehydrogenase family protein [Candidatus Omnitrophota bacterium]